MAITNKLDQVWISKNPILLFVYLAQYAPNLTNWLDHSISPYECNILVCIILYRLGKRLGNKRAKAVKAGKHVSLLLLCSIL